MIYDFTSKDKEKKCQIEPQKGRIIYKNAKNGIATNVIMRINKCKSWSFKKLIR